MKKLALALILCLWSSLALAQVEGTPNAILCNQSFQVSQAATSLTKIVSNVANKQISICGWSFNSGAATSTAQLQYGSGTNCGSGGTAITPVISLAINGIWVDRINFAWFSIPRSNDLCLVTTGTGPAQVMVYYTIQ